MEDAAEALLLVRDVRRVSSHRVTNGPRSAAQRRGGNLCERASGGQRSDAAGGQKECGEMHESGAEEQREEEEVRVRGCEGARTREEFGGELGAGEWEEHQLWPDENSLARWARPLPPNAPPLLWEGTMAC